MASAASTFANLTYVVTFGFKSLGNSKVKQPTIPVAMKFHLSLVTAALVFSDVISARAEELTPSKVSAIAPEAFIYGFPLVEGYKT